MLQYSNMSNYHVVHLKFTQCYAWNVFQGLFTLTTELSGRTPHSPHPNLSCVDEDRGGSEALTQFAWGWPKKKRLEDQAPGDAGPRTCFPWKPGNHRHQRPYPWWDTCSRFLAPVQLTAPGLEGHSQHPPHPSTVWLNSGFSRTVHTITHVFSPLLPGVSWDFAWTHMAARWGWGGGGGTGPGDRVQSQADFPSTPGPLHKVFPPPRALYFLLSSPS